MLEKDPAARPASMAEVEALICEAQIAAGITHRVGRSGSAAGRRRLAREARAADAVGAAPAPDVAVAASVVAAASLATAGYLMFFRKPTVVVKEVRVELTKTEEAPEVAAAAAQGRSGGARANATCARG